MSNIFKKSIFGIALTLIIGLSSSLFAQSGKIGFVDLDEVAKRFYKTQVYQLQIKEELSQEETNFKEKVDEINRIKQEMELLSDDARTEKQKLLQAKIAEAQGSRDRTKRDFQRKAINTMNEIFDEIYVEIEKQGKAGGFDYIIRKRLASPTLDQFIILYGNDKYDLTEQIIEALNKGHKEELEQLNKKTEAAEDQEMDNEMPKSLETE
ncbi:OmpH family outer membrane protein [bacterium]|nr:OmpH family outer membrane protein [bacterium]